MGMNGGGGGGGDQNAATDGRTFTWIGPNDVSVDTQMGGSLTLADGSSIDTWYFSDGGGFNGDRDLGGPVIEAREGDAVDVTLSAHNPHTLHLHGLDVSQANDGVCKTSGFVAMMEPNDNFGRVGDCDSLGSSYTYQFVAPHAGTYMYHCHVDTVLHFEYGMWGTVIVRPPDGATQVAWDGGPSFAKEYVWQLHTFDSSWHSQDVSGSNTVRHRPDYFLINGRDGSSTGDDSTVAIAAGAGEKVLIRLNGVGYQPARVTLDGLSFDVIASDGRPLPEAIAATEWMIAPGERYDLLLTMPPSGSYTASVEYFNPRLEKVLGTVSAPVTVA